MCGHNSLQFLSLAAFLLFNLPSSSSQKRKKKIVLSLVGTQGSVNLLLYFLQKKNTNVWEFNRRHKIIIYLFIYCYLLAGTLFVVAAADICFFRWWYCGLSIFSTFLPLHFFRWWFVVFFEILPNFCSHQPCSFYFLFLFLRYG